MRCMLKEGWLFAKPGEIPQPVTLPHTWNAVDGADGKNDYFRGLCTYTLELPAVDHAEDERVLLTFYGVNQTAAVYLNETFVGGHEGGYSAFQFDITPYFTEGKGAMLKVIADNSVSDHVYPQSADFTFFGGIYRDVVLSVENVSRFDFSSVGRGVKITPFEQDGWKVSCIPHVLSPEGCAIDWTVSDEKGEIVASARTAAEGEVVFEIKEPHLWEGLERPCLYTLTAVLQKDGREVSRFTHAFGLRTIAFDPEKGFLLNGRVYPLRGVSRHQDRAGMGYAIGRREHEEDVSLILELGANSVRLAHYQHDDYFYELCDKYGLVVWAEVPYITESMPAGSENILSQLRELISQNYNHASIVCWSLSNEITLRGVTDEIVSTHQKMKELAASLDATRPTVMAHISMLPPSDPFVETTNICAYNHYFGWYQGDVSEYLPWFEKFHRDHPDVCIGLSEYGADALVRYQSGDPEVGDFTESYQEYYHEQVLEQIEKMPYLWCTYVWNMFDFGSDAREEGGESGINHKGLMTYDRKLRKDAFYVYKARWSKEPFVHLAGRRYQKRHEKTTSIRVYTNLPHVKLFVDGKLVAEKEGKYFFPFEIPLTGKRTVRAEAGGLFDEMELEYVDMPCAEYVCGREGEGVANWFSESGYSLRDKVGTISQNPEGLAVLEELFSLLVARRKAMGAPVTEGGNAVRNMKNYSVAKVLNMTGSLLSDEEIASYRKRLSEIERV